MDLSTADDEDDLDIIENKPKKKFHKVESSQSQYIEPYI